MDETLNLYIKQLLETATGGVVTAQKFLNADVLYVYCTKCKCCITTPLPGGTTVDSTFMEFVKAHAHKNESPVTNKVFSYATGYNYDQWAYVPLQQGFNNYDIPPVSDILAKLGKEMTSNKEWVIVDGKKIYWVRNAEGEVIGVRDTPEPPKPPASVKPKREGRKFR
jgi:hypothetical protein